VGPALVVWKMHRLRSPRIELPEEAPEREQRRKQATMLWTIAVILLVLWGLGLVTSYTMGGFIHVLLVLAVISVAIRLIRGRRVLP